MKKIHLICNAHLDPVWLWRWDEGCTEALSTFHTANQLLDEFEGTVFNHNEALLYQWVKENNSELYREIQEKVKSGKWKIMGGWYLQPDCNLPAGESMVRNILEGRRFFQEEFGEYPLTAINFDPFGHSVGLASIMAKAGYRYYLICRPGTYAYDFPDKDFIWRGKDGAEIIVHRSDEFYNSVLGEIDKKLDKFLEADNTREDLDLMLWGVGDHGGGPSRIDLKKLKEYMESESAEAQLLHSDPDSYFNELMEQNREMPVVEKSLTPICEGCYTSQSRVKQKHRLLESELYLTEKMMVQAELTGYYSYPKERIKDVVKSLLFAEFHDALPGSGTKLVEEDTLREMDYGLVVLAREKMKAFLALCRGQEPVKEGTSCVMIYNPHPYPVTGDFEFETSLPAQNWDRCFYYPEAECNGEKVPTQSEMESSHFCIDWRKKVVIHATLKPCQVNRVDVSFKAIEKRPVYDRINKALYEFDNGRIQVGISTQTGLLEYFRLDGKQMLGSGSCALRTYDDTCNSWGLASVNGAKNRKFDLLTAHEGSAYSGLAEKVIPSVRIIEDGEVRTVVEAVYGWHDSYACQRYILPKKGTGFEVEVHVQWNEKDTYLKWELETEDTASEYEGQVMFAKEWLKADSREQVAQKWLMCHVGDDSLAIINDSTYGNSKKDKTLGITLLRSAGYSAGDGDYERTLQEERYTERMDQGEHVYKFRIEAGKTEELSHTIDSKAQLFHEKPYAVSLNAPVKGEKVRPSLLVDNEAIVLSALKAAEDENGYIARLYESEGKEQEVIVEWLGEKQTLTFSPYDIRTFRVTKDGKMVEIGLLET